MLGFDPAVLKRRSKRCFRILPNRQKSTPRQSEVDHPLDFEAWTGGYPVRRRLASRIRFNIAPEPIGHFGPRRFCTLCHVTQLTKNPPPVRTDGGQSTYLNQRVSAIS